MQRRLEKFLNNKWLLINEGTAHKIDHSLFKRKDMWENGAPKVQGETKKGEF